MQRFLRGFAHAGRGIAVALRGELNIKVMLVMAVVAVGLGIWRGLGPVEWAVVALCVGLVLSLEILNTAGEKLLDLLHPQQHPEVGRIKDMLAGAVLVAAVAAGVTGLAVIFF